MHVCPKPLRPVMHFACLVLCFSCSILLWSLPAAYAQEIPDEQISFMVIPATENYHQNKTFKKFWGENYRIAWHTAVPFKIVQLDTLAGGLYPYDINTQKQTTAILLRNNRNQEYVLRSFNKKMSNALPPEIRGTILEDVADDQITFTFPYAPLVASALAKAAGVYHTNPQLVFVPHQNRLMHFDDSLRSSLFLFEENPIGNWENAENFGNAKEIIDSKQMLENLWKNNKFQVNQASFLRARLLDMCIGDWDRNEDNWRWASFEQDDRIVYEPIPIERDFAFSKPGGIFPNMLMGMTGTDHIQPYDYEIKKIPEYQFLAKNLDHHLLNGLSFYEWMTIAEDVQKRLSDTVIIRSIQNLPLEIQKIYGAGLAGKLKSRRDFLKIYAEKYYQFLSKTVTITGTAQADYFLITHALDGNSSVEVFDRMNDAVPYYFRFFKSSETDEIRIFGLEGKDSVLVKGSPNMRLRLIGGEDPDAYRLEQGTRKTGKRILVYDDYTNNILGDKRKRVLKLTNDPAVYRFDYEHFKYNKSSFEKMIWYNNVDRFHIVAGYLSKKRHFRKEDWGMIQESSIKYSFSQNAFSAFHQTTINQLFGKWNAHGLVNYDRMRWVNFHGLGNESELHTKSKSFYRVRSRLLLLEAGLSRPIAKQSAVGIGVRFLGMDILQDTAGYFYKLSLASDKKIFKPKHFFEGEAFYTYQKYNDVILPVKGFRWENRFQWQQNIHDPDHSIAKLHSEMTKYSFLSHAWSLKNKLGAATIWGNPQFYQLKKLGGDDNLRGYNRERFYGNQIFYAQNEIRYIKNIHSYYYNGKLGFFLLYDLGRVWVPDEYSEKWHSGYGIGIIVSPFNMISFEFAAARSAEYNFNLHVNVVKAF